ncbi:unnamed protein product, partial [Prorocentrum cordatum]
DQARALLVAADKVRLGLAGSVRDFRLSEDCDGNADVLARDAHGGGIAYTGAPAEAVNYVSAHDNETLYDNTVWKMPPSLFSPEERARANWLCSAVVLLAHGVPFLHAGDEVLRSKSLDRDSYNSGDWFNALDFDGERSAFGSGLPPHSKNGEKWDLMRPLLEDPSLRPTREMAAATTAKLLELLRVRRSTPLIGLWDAADVLEKVTFPCCGPSQPPGVVVMQTRNGPPAGAAAGAAGTLCPNLARVVVVLSARLEECRVPVCPPGGGGLRLHPLQAASEDARTRTARFDSETGEVVSSGCRRVRGAAARQGGLARRWRRTPGGRRVPLDLRATGRGAAPRESCRGLPGQRLAARVSRSRLDSAPSLPRLPPTSPPPSPSRFPPLARRRSAGRAA